MKQFQIPNSKFQIIRSLSFSGSFRAAAQSLSFLPLYFPWQSAFLAASGPVPKINCPAAG